MTDLPRCYAVFGHPIAHSRSPRMHEAAFAALGEPHRYLAFDVLPRALPAALRGAAALGLGGINLTVPHKEAAVALVDEASETVRRIGALNTVVIDGDRLVGHTTDGEGFLAGLAELGAPPNRRAVVLGGGGAGRSVVDALVHASSPFEVAWISRVPQRLPRWPGTVTADWEAIAEAAVGAGLLVDTTTVGMAGGPTTFPRPIPIDALHDETIVCDAVYPRPTAGGLADAALGRGLRYQDGLPMLLWQGVRAQELWRGAPLSGPTVAAMRAALA